MKLIEFTPPKGFGVPEGKSGGDTFEAMATFRIKPNGRMCLVAIGDHKLPGYDDKSTRYEAPSNADVTGKYHEAMA